MRTDMRGLRLFHIATMPTIRFVDLDARHVRIPEHIDYRNVASQGPIGGCLPVCENTDD